MNMDFVKVQNSKNYSNDKFTSFYNLMNQDSKHSNYVNQALFCCNNFKNQGGSQCLVKSILM